VNSVLVQGVQLYPEHYWSDSQRTFRKIKIAMLFDMPSTAVDDPQRDERFFMSRYPSQQDGSNALHRRSMEE
jgi:hypothetical protein